MKDKHFIGIRLEAAIRSGNVISNEQINSFATHFVLCIGNDVIGFGSKSNTDQVPLSPPCWTFQFICKLAKNIWTLHQGDRKSLRAFMPSSLITAFLDLVLGWICR